MDSVAPGVAPQRSDFNGYAIYFLAWIFVGNFIALNLFIGAIVDNFIRIKAETDGSATMTDGQLQWVNTMKSMVSQKADKSARRPAGAVRRACFALVTSRPAGFATPLPLPLPLPLTRPLP